MNKPSCVIKKKGVSGSVTGQWGNTRLYLHTPKSMWLAGIKIFASTLSRLSHSVSHPQLAQHTPQQTHNDGREDGDGWSWDVSRVLGGEDPSGQTPQQVWEGVSAVPGRAGGDCFLCVHRLCVGHRERWECREAAAGSGARPGCGCPGGLYGWDQVRLILSVWYILCKFYFI